MRQTKLDASNTRNRMRAITSTMGAFASKDCSIRLLTVATGMVYLLVCYHSPRMINLELGYQVGLAILMLAPIAMALSFLSHRSTWAIGPFMLLGVSLGVLLDVALDRKEDRNLFPVEMVAWSAMLAPGIFLGSVVGTWLKGKRPTLKQGR